MDVTLAVDCMGGDHGPDVTVPAVMDFLRAAPAARAILVGQTETIARALTQCRGAESQRVRVHAATQVVAMDESPSLALRNKKDSSMRVAIDLVKSGEADACVSAGNTGALMATSRFVLKMLPGIDRPAICTELPSLKRPVYVLDLGANVDCEPEHLLQFSVMGSALAAAVGQREEPSVGLLNIGEEEIKGNDTVKRAADLLRSSGLNFYGNIEGDDIYKGTTDVVVCDGFVGNVMLKTSEGLAQMLATILRNEFKRNLLTRLAALLAMPVLNAFRRQVDHRNYNGASLLGLKGVVIKSHGSADRHAFACALRRAHDAAAHGVLQKIVDSLAEQRSQPSGEVVA